MSATTDDGQALRNAVKKAIIAYNLAVAASLRATQQADEGHRRRQAAIESQEHAATAEAERKHQERLDEASTVVTRIGKLVREAEGCEQTAARLLRAAGMARAHVVDPHVFQTEPSATEERALAALNAGREAMLEIGTALLRLARAIAASKDWEHARHLLTAIQPELPEPLRDQASGLLCAVYLDEARAAIEADNWRHASQLVEFAVDILADGTAIDSELANALLRTTSDLVMCAISANRLTELANLAAIAQRLGHEEPRIRRLAQYHPWVGWTCRQGALMHEFTGHIQPVQDVAFTRDGQHLVSVDGVDARTWSIPDSAQGKLVRSVPVREGYWLTVDGSLVATITGELRSAGDGSLRGRLTEDPCRRIAFVSFSADGSLHACATRDRDASLRGTLIGKSDYSIEGEADVSIVFMKYGDPEGRLRKHKGAVMHGNLTYAGSYGRPSERPVLIYYVKSIEVNGSDRRSWRFPVEPRRLAAEIRVSPDGKLMACFGQTTEVLLIDLASGRTRHVLQCFAGETVSDCISFSANGDLLAISKLGLDWQTRLEIWETDSGRKVWSLLMPGGITSLAFSRDGRLIAIMNAEGAIGLLDVHRQAVIPEILKHEPAGFACMSFSPDNKRLAISEDTNIKIWGLR